jgi:hypothetical protein
VKLYPVVVVFVFLAVVTGCTGVVTPEILPTATTATTRLSQTPESSLAPATMSLPPTTETPPAQATATRPGRPTPSGTVLYVETVPPPDEDRTVVGEAPGELLEEIIVDVMQRSGRDRESIEVVRAEAVVWNDGALGCPEPGMFYTQALVNGYRVVLEAGGQTYDYRATEAGVFRLCEHGDVDLSVPGLPGTNPER